MVFHMHYENSDNPYADRKRQIGLWEEQASDVIAYTWEILTKAREIMSLGIRAKDALHLTCAVRANADFFITTDRKLLNKTVGQIAIVNPIDFLRGYLNEN